GQTGDQDARSLEIAADAQHRVEILDAGGNGFVGDGVTEPGRRDRQNAYAVVVDQKWILVGAVGRAPVLDDAQAPRDHLILDAVVQQDHAVGDVLLDSETGKLALAALGRDDGGYAPVLQPAEQAAKFGAQNRGVREAGKKRLDGIEDDPLGPDRIDRVAEPDE